MLKEIITGIIISVVSSLITEFLKSKNSKVSFSFNFGNIIIAGIIGFFGSAIVAGLIEKPDDKIEFGSNMFYFLLIVCSIVGYFIVSSIRKN